MSDSQPLTPADAFLALDSIVDGSMLTDTVSEHGKLFEELCSLLRAGTIANVGNLTQVATLLKHIDFSLEHSNQQRVLMHALSASYPICVDLILDKIEQTVAFPDERVKFVTLKDEDGCSPIQLAFKLKNPWLASMILRSITSWGTAVVSPALELIKIECRPLCTDDELKRLLENNGEPLYPSQTFIKGQPVLIACRIDKSNRLEYTPGWFYSKDEKAVTPNLVGYDPTFLPDPQKTAVRYLAEPNCLVHVTLRNLHLLG